MSTMYPLRCDQHVIHGLPPLPQETRPRIFGVSSSKALPSLCRTLEELRSDYGSPSVCNTALHAPSSWFTCFTTSPCPSKAPSVHPNGEFTSTTGFNSLQVLKKTLSNRVLN